MARYEATYHAPHGGTQTETFDAKDHTEAKKKAVRYKRSFGSSASGFRITLRKVSD